MRDPNWKRPEESIILDTGEWRIIDYRTQWIVERLEEDTWRVYAFCGTKLGITHTLFTRFKVPLTPEQLEIVENMPRIYPKKKKPKTKPAAQKT